MKSLPATTPQTRDARRRSKEELESNWQDLLKRSFTWLLTDNNLEAKLEKSSMAHISIALGTAQDKLALLRGEPSVLVGIQERQKMDELLPALQAEIQRRQLAGGTITLSERKVEIGA